MCITAFPMLARIIQERGLTGTTIGTLALSAGAIDDAAAWCLLAVVLGSYGGNWQLAFYAIGGGLLYSTVILIWGRHWLSFLGRRVEKEGRMNPPVLAAALLFAMLGSWITDLVGIHAVLGAFMMGVAMPRGLFAKELREHMESFVLVFLVPLFFTYSGLNTRIDLVNTPALWALALLVFLVACLGKGGACWAAARLHGEDQRHALGIGTLMNARGLMELVILNIGLQQGIIGPTLFSIMVIMAVGTTLMATPVFERVYGRNFTPEKTGDPVATARD
jgi:Kef-type K+ transport system membrane component KefB